MSNIKISSMPATNYKATLVVPAIDPSLPVEQRNVSITVDKIANAATAADGGTTIIVNGTTESILALGTGFTVTGTTVSVAGGDSSGDGTVLTFHGTTETALALDPSTFTINAGTISSIGGTSTPGGSLTVGSAVTTMSTTDLFVIEQDGTLTQILATDAIAALGAVPTAIAGSGIVNLNTVSDGRRLVFTAAGVVINTGTVVQDGYSILVRNASTTDTIVQFGTGIIADGSLSAGQAAFVSAEKIGDTVTVFADVIGGSSSDEAFTVGKVTALAPNVTLNSGTLAVSAPPLEAISVHQVTPILIGTTFAVTGGINASLVTTTTPAINYSDDGAPSVDAGATITPYGVNAGNYSFIHPTIATPGTISLTVSTADGFVSATRTIIAVAEPSLIFGAVAQPFVPAGNTHTETPLRVMLAGYSDPASLDITLDAGTTWAAFSNDTVFGAGTISGVSASATLVTGTIELSSGTHVIEFRDNATQSRISNAQTLNVEAASLTNAGTVAITSSAFSAGTIALTGIGTVYAGLYNAGTLDGTRLAVTAGPITMTPTLAGTETLNVYDAAVNGNLLAQGPNVIVAQAPAITVRTPSLNTPSTATTIAGSYAGSAPTTVEVSWDDGTTWTTLTTASIANGTWSGQTSTPTAASTYTIQARYGNITAVSAIAPSTTTIGSFTGPHTVSLHPQQVLPTTLLPFGPNSYGIILKVGGGVTTSVYAVLSTDGVTPPTTSIAEPNGSATLLNVLPADPAPVDGVYTYVTQSQNSGLDINFTPAAPTPFYCWALVTDANGTYANLLNTTPILISLDNPGNGI